MYTGTWPHYGENDLGFDPGRAIIARASASRRSYRHDFDVSFPLFHKDVAERGVVQVSSSFASPKTRLVAFKVHRFFFHTFNPRKRMIQY
jgi:glucuronyl/N-acetylglucosaminyl transferase EXT1